jgi:hypothetical protein
MGSGEVIEMSNDAITDYPYSIAECRGLMKICLKLKLGHTDTYRGYKKTLKQLEQKALRGAAMETPDETRARSQKREMFHVEQ